MDVLDKIIDGVLAAEGGYTNNPSDPGGATNYGITEAVARKYGYKGDMKYLPLSLAREIYHNLYITKPNFHEVLRIASPELAEELVDSGVNCGVVRASKWLQQSLNAFNLNEKLYKDLVVDGSIGKGTLSALEAFMKHRGSEGAVVLTKACNALQGAYYIEISQNNKKLEDFVYGWIKNRV